MADPNSTPLVTILKAPNRKPHTSPSVFLAGSIEMGLAADWQVEFTTFLSTHTPIPLTIFNPRRSDWDSSWKQEISNPQFRQQVEWELDSLDEASVIALYLAPGSQSPISLLELGLHAMSGKLIVCCPEGFWRRGNVQVVCERGGVELVETMGELERRTLDLLCKWQAPEV